MDLIGQLVLGICLAAACGLRAFVPLLVVGAAARAGYVHLNPTVAWLGTNPALIVLGTAAVLELLADKVPFVHHLLDIVQTVVRPAAGFLVVAGSAQHLSPMSAAVLGLVVGTPIAGGVHVLRSGARVATTFATAGMASPAVSLLEDISSGVMALVAIAAPFAGLALVVVAGLFAVDMARRIRARKATATGPIIGSRP